jgi:hypothetical protein
VKPNLATAAKKKLAIQQDLDLDPAIVRIIEALARAAARRQHELEIKEGENADA